jgi:hypothetical protein
LDLETLRAIVGTGPSDESLQAALDAALEALDNRYGPNTDDESGGGTATDYLRPFGQWVKLSRRASEITSVLEGSIVGGMTEVDEADYVLWEGGKYLRRLRDAEPTRWTSYAVEVEYVPFSEARERDRIIIGLVQFSLRSRSAPGGRSIRTSSVRTSSPPARPSWALCDLA